MNIITSKNRCVCHRSHHSFKALMFAFPAVQTFSSPSGQWSGTLGEPSAFYLALNFPPPALTVGHNVTCILKLQLNAQLQQKTSTLKYAFTTHVFR